MPADLQISPDIHRASTLPGRFYSNAAAFDQTREVFARSWQFVGTVDDLRTPGTLSPLTLLPDFLNEPLLLVRDLEDQIHCLSNVCTHRGVLLAEGRGHARFLKCRYHGRRFRLDGRCLGMPEFEQVPDFPSPSDDLPKLGLGQWASLLFAHLEPQHPFDDFIAPVNQALPGFDHDALKPEPRLSRDYLVRAHWALYCDNYLESFHVPFVHQSLAEKLDYQQIGTELFEGGSLQIGMAANEEDALDLPADSPFHGQKIAALYFFLFPNLMLNFYPWGLSLNLVEPLAVDRTRVRFRAFVHTPEKLNVGAGSDLDRVEREDEEIVESAQYGTRSRLYRAGRYSPTQERAVHHFHRQLASQLGT